MCALLLCSQRRIRHAARLGPATTLSIAKPRVLVASQQGGAVWLLGGSVFLSDSTELRNCFAEVSIQKRTL